jgi:serine/threonine protein kinase
MQMEGKKLGGRYEIISRVGGGGMAVVYKARDLLLNRYVAIKVLSESLSNDSEFIRRFSREAQAAASLSHPNIVNVYDVGRDGYTHYIVMELVEGPTLKQYIQERGPLPVEEAANIAIQICDGLAHAHENQIVHRDIKPHNILLGPNGRVKVTDFGIARAASSSTITQTGSVMGSVHYFSPEQARGGVIGEKSDLYSLGIVMYEMLTGRIPFDGDSAISIALKHLQETPEDPRTFNPNIPDSMVAIISRALEKDPAMRFPSARAMMQEIQRAVRMDVRSVSNWNTPHRPKQEVYQAIPLALDEDTGRQPVATAVENAPYLSPTQRPEIRSGAPRKEVRSANPIGQRTLANLERLRSVPGDKEQSIFQKTVVWLENVQANLPWWQKILFGLFTIVLIFGLSTWLVMTVWGFIAGHGNQQQSQVNGNAKVTQGITVPAFTSVDDAKQFAKEHSLPNPEIKYKKYDGNEKKKILDQSPKPGETIGKDQKITLWVPGGIMVDNLIGKWESKVKQLAKEHGYTLEPPIQCDLGPGHDYAHIYAQDPQPGTILSPGQTVRVWEHIPGIPCKVSPPVGSGDNGDNTDNGGNGGQ